MGKVYRIRKGTTLSLAQIVTLPTYAWTSASILLTDVRAKSLPQSYGITASLALIGVNAINNQMSDYKLMLFAPSTTTENWLTRGIDDALNLVGSLYFSDASTPPVVWAPLNNITIQVYQ